MKNQTEMSKEELQPHEISRNNLKAEVKILKQKRKDLMSDIKYIETSFNGGLAVDCMEVEVVIQNVVRVLNERMHHAYMFFCDDNEGLDWFRHDGSEIVFDYDGTVLLSVDDWVESFAKVYKSCVDKIIENEVQNDMKLFFASLYFHGDKDNETEELLKEFNK